MLPIHCVKITQPLSAKTRNGLAQIRRPTATKIRNPERTQILGVSAEKLGAVQLHSEEEEKCPLTKYPDFRYDQKLLQQVSSGNNLGKCLKSRNINLS